MADHHEFTNEDARRAFDAIAVVACGAAIYFAYVYILRPWLVGLFWQLDRTIEANYGWLFGIIVGPWVTGWYGSWFVVALLVGFVFRRMAEGFGAVVVVIVLYGLWSRGMRTQYINARGELVDVYSEDARASGRGIVLFIGLAITAFIVYNVALAGAGHALLFGHLLSSGLVAGAGHAAGHHHDRMSDIPWRVWKWVFALLFIPPLIHQLWVAGLGIQGVDGQNLVRWFGFLVAVVVFIWIIKNTRPRGGGRRSSGETHGGSAGHGGGGGHGGGHH